MSQPPFIPVGKELLEMDPSEAFPFAFKPGHEPIPHQCYLGHPISAENWLKASSIRECGCPVF